MPFPGIESGSELEKKIDNCVESIMANDDSIDKSSAIAICRDRMEKSIHVPVKNKELKRKTHFGVPFGVTSFDELDAVREAQIRAEKLTQLTFDFQDLVWNVIHDEDIEDKATQIRQLASGLADQLEGDAIKEAKRPKGFIETLKQKFRKPAQSDGKEINRDLLVYKDGVGQYRWIARYSNNFRDDDRPSEIIAAESHKKFAALVKAKAIPAPELWLWHRPEWKWGSGEWVVYDDAGFSLAGGTVDKGCEDVAEAFIAVEPGTFLLSHGMPKWSISRDSEDKSVITEHITKEISPLPSWAAANKFTGFMVGIETDKENISMAISKEDKSALMEDYGISQDLLARLEAMNDEDALKALDESRESKEVTPPVEEETPETETTETAPETAEAETDQDEVDLKEIYNVLKETVKAVTALGVEMQTLKKEQSRIAEAEDKRVAEKARQTPLASLTSLMVNSVVGNEGARVDGRTVLAKDRPQETPVPIRGGTGIPFVDAMITNADLEQEAA